MHYQYYCGQTRRSKFQKILTECLGNKYEKNSDSIYQILKPLQKTAIQNAKKLWKNCEQQIGNYIGNYKGETDKLIKKNIMSTLPQLYMN